MVPAPLKRIEMRATHYLVGVTVVARYVASPPVQGPFEKNWDPKDKLALLVSESRKLPGAKLTVPYGRGPFPLPVEWVGFQGILELHKFPNLGLWAAHHPQKYQGWNEPLRPHPPR